MNDQAFSSPNESAAAMRSPRSPASAAAKGSQNTASRRAVSRARYTAIQRAVSETSRISGSALIRAQGYHGRERSAYAFALRGGNARLTPCAMRRTLGLRIRATGRERSAYAFALHHSREHVARRREP